MTRGDMGDAFRYDYRTSKLGSQGEFPTKNELQQSVLNWTDILTRCRTQAGMEDLATVRRGRGSPSNPEAEWWLTQMFEFILMAPITT